MTLDEAIDIVWGIGQFTGKAKPTAPQALEIIEEQLRSCGFNWITGQAVREVLKSAVTPNDGLEQDNSTKGKS